MREGEELWRIGESESGTRRQSVSGVRGLRHIYGLFNRERRNYEMLKVELVFLFTSFGQGKY